MVKKLTRKQFLRYSGLTTISTVLPGIFGCSSNSDTLHQSTETQKLKASAWDQGDLVHLIPTANHNRFLIKTSFHSPLTTIPKIQIDGRYVDGKRQDTQGRFWSFDIRELNSSTEYTLQLYDNDLKRLTDSWPLQTFPNSNENVQSLRILTYTCGGGDEELVLADGQASFIPLEHRQRLLARGLSMNPNVVIANGDHVYWDEQSMTRNKPKIIMDAWRKLQSKLGVLDRGKAILGTSNEVILKRVVDRQIAQLYGVSLRSTPTFMLTDDHDLFENDEATDDYKTLPPIKHLLDVARATQHLYYPEFLPDENRPLNLPGSDLVGRVSGLSESFGTFRYGKLFEGLLYDTKRYVSINGESAHMVPPDVERWLLDRTAKVDTTHLAHIPSTPIAWSAGKWGEWYPDVVGKEGRLVVDKSKPYWPSGWWRQHQRILKGLSEQLNRIPLILSGDLHMFAGVKILRSGELDLKDNPVHSFVVGPLGTDGPAYPSAARGVLPETPTAVKTTEYQSPLEKNGFTIIDISPEAVAIEFYAWRSPEPEEMIDRMVPVNQIVIKKRG